jgi:signal transduction histidine kinase
MSSLTSILQEQWKYREPRVVRWPQPDRGPGETDRMALMLPMRYGTTVSGVLVLTNADGCAECGQDDLILGQGLADQAAVAIANARLLAQVRETATLEERTRLARDIHDTLAQGLTGIVVQLGAAQRALAVAPGESREHLVLAQRMARESLAEARRSVWNLRAPALDRGDLADALRSVAVRPLGSDVAVTFEQAGEPWSLTTAIESTLLRVAQEALANVARHSQATEAWMALIYVTDSVQLSVRDNGVGFDPEAGPEKGITPGPWGGFGLLGMEERVSALGGTLTLSSQNGTLLLATIPRPASAAPTGPNMMSEREGAK